MARSIRDVLALLCRLYNGRSENGTCYLPSMQNAWWLIHDLSEKVIRGEAIPDSRAEIVVHRFERGHERTLRITLIPRGREHVTATASASSRIIDRLSRWFRREAREDNAHAEGIYHIEMSNEYILRSHGKIETTWRSLEDDLHRLTSSIDQATFDVAGIEKEAWEWFKKKVQEATDWFDLTRRVE